ncbi:hypothetical protein REPUB_Repub15cG0033900 [Reevesia pubescens]
MAPWVPHPQGFLKFNVDGSALGKPSLAGIGGVLRNDKAFSIFASSKWLSSYGVIIESDSMNVVNWFNNRALMPWKLKRHRAAIDSLLEVVLIWKVQHVLREANKLADSLARAGVHGRDNLRISFA